MPLSEKIKELKLEGTQRYIQLIHSIFTDLLPLLVFSTIGFIRHQLVSCHMITLIDL